MTTEQWLTYQQASEKFSMSSEAVRQRARRLGWRTQRGNDGKTLVLVPADITVQPRVRATVQSDGQPLVQPAEITALSTLMNTLQDQLDKAQAMLEQERRQHLLDRTRLADELQAERSRHHDIQETEKARHAHDITWHRSVIDQLQKQLVELQARPWWRRVMGGKV